ncbi:protein-glutamate methylesterase/protein-glutamine glutaminase [Agaribacterium haliotis]|uniref:protein-glutamate methylesterase/protein-glutamine glutaminase n=1 Tax=Agaribacterium haliotis TaxID=2013869 RepID=UPI000BB5447A|nr:chemotaxis response regulator protein-glutamate methylesterase [Agaribacterium haliotis]
MNNKKIKVLIVDDSALIRALLTEVLKSDAEIDVCGVACDPYEARELIKQLNPDVLTLDIEMPKMNGITFLKNLMRLRPMPVVMISTLTQEGAPATLEALELGAIDFVAKPKNEGADALARYAEHICLKVKAAARANIRQSFALEGKELPAVDVPRLSGGRSNYLCAIGASTGGTEAIKEVVSCFPENCPPTLITQHIPESFSASFARRVDSQSAAKVYEAEQDQLVESGCVYIAPGHSHLMLKRKGKDYYCHLDQGAPVNRHRPAVEVLFDSVLTLNGANAIGVLLTGMGQDGAQALLRMRKAGAMTIAQDESSSVVWGMPGAAVALQAASKVLSIDRIASAILADYVRAK